jgi:tetratricopeptide (TPR) repeat protein
MSLQENGERTETTSNLSVRRGEKMAVSGKTRNNAGALSLLLLINSMFVVQAAAQTEDAVTVTADAETQELLFRAEDLLSNGLSQNAYDLLIEEEASLAGNALYDYLLGVAAMDSGQHGQAIFSLQRSLAVKPGFSGARMELARAYYEVGSEGLARPLFVMLLDENPPPAVRTVLNSYIRAIDAAPKTLSSSFTAYADMNLGYDSNANGSTSDQQFLGFTLSPDNVETSSPFIELGTGFDWFVPRSQRFSWIVSARASQRVNPDASFVDATIISGLAGMNWQRGAFFGRANLDGYWGARAGESNESYGGLDVLLGRQLGSRWDVSLGLRGGAQRFDESIEVLDVDRFLYTVGLTRRFHGAIVSLLAIGGEDSEVQNGSPYGNSKTGSRLSVNATIGDSALLFASLGTLTSDYDGDFFGSAREDTQVTSFVQLEFQDVLTDGLSIAPRIRYVNNDSDIKLYEYDRTEYGVMFRWAGK